MNIARTLQILACAASLAASSLAIAAEPAAPIPTVTITAKHLTPAEKAQMDQEDAKQEAKQLAGKKAPLKSSKSGMISASQKPTSC